MKRLFLCLTIIFLTDWDSATWSQGPWPSRKDLSVKFYPKVEQGQDGLYNYIYRISNDKNSKQPVHWLAINVTMRPREIISPSSWHRKGRFTGHFVRWTPAVFRKGSIDENVEMSINFPPVRSIYPGDLSDEFGLSGAEGLPGIVTWKLAGWAPLPKLVDGEDVITAPDGTQYPVDQWADTILNKSESIPNANSATNALVGKTIGPVPSPVNPAVMCDTFILDLISQVREAVSLGWIKHDLRKDDDKGVKKGQDDDGDDHADDDVGMDEKDKGFPGAAKSIIKKLTKVRRECMRGKLGNAREKLRALIKQVNAHRGKHLTDEAYFLLRFNAEYLLSKL